MSNTKEFKSPVDLRTHVISSLYGYRSFIYNGKPYSDFHHGIDLAPKDGKSISDVYAVWDGRVLSAFRDSRGNTILTLDHGNNVKTRYIHVSRFLVSVGQTVYGGQVIAKTGSEGFSTGIHLHFEILQNDKSLDPLPYIEGKKSFADLVAATQVQPDNTYTVQPGDTLWAIGQRFGVDWRRIAEANGISDPRKLAVGQKLVMPPAAQPQNTQQTRHIEYRVRAGDTLWRIARDHNVDLSRLIAYNMDRKTISDPNKIYPGQVIYIPL